MSVPELKERHRALDQRIEVKEQRIDLKEQDIRDKERKFDELMREIVQKATQFTSKAVMRLPITQTQTRTGRKGFDKHLAGIFSFLRGSRSKASKAGFAIVRRVRYTSRRSPEATPAGAVHVSPGAPGVSK